MKAAVFHGQKDVRLDDVPEVHGGSVKAKVDWCGICGTDLQEYLADPIFIPPPGARIRSRARRCRLPWATSSPARSSK